MPRDEALEKGKRDAFNLGKLKGILRNIIPSLNITDTGYVKRFSDLNSLYNERTLLGMKSQDRSQMRCSLPKMIVEVQNVTRSQAYGHEESLFHGKEKGMLGP